MKYDLSIFGDSTNPIWGAMVEVNIATNGMFMYLLHLMVFLIAVYIVNRRTGDAGFSIIFSQFITLLLSVILFSGGMVSGVYFVSVIFLVLQAVLFAGHIGYRFYFSVDKDG